MTEHVDAVVLGLSLGKGGPVRARVGAAGRTTPGRAWRNVFEAAAAVHGEVRWVGSAA